MTPLCKILPLISAVPLIIPVAALAERVRVGSFEIDQTEVTVGTTRSGVNGLFDMGANAWEWLADRREGDALTAVGSWWYGPQKTKAQGMQWKPADFYVVYIGFRCVYR